MNVKLLASSLAGGAVAMLMMLALTLSRTEPWPYARLELIVSSGILGGFVGLSTAALQGGADVSGKSGRALWFATGLGCIVGFMLPTKDPVGMALVVGILSGLIFLRWGPRPSRHVEGTDRKRPPDAQS